MEMKRPLSDSMTRMPWTAKAPPIVALAKALVLKSPSIRRSIRASTWGVVASCCFFLVVAMVIKLLSLTWLGWSYREIWRDLPAGSASGSLWPSRADAPPENTDEVAAVPPGLLPVT